VTDPVAEALDKFVPAFESAEGDWQGILDTATLPSVVISADRESRHRFVPNWRPQRRGRTLWVAVALLATVAVATAAVAAALGAFNGIGAAQHPVGTADVLDPATAAYVQQHLAGIQLDTTRHIGQLPDGQNIYVITGTQNDLCTVVGPPNAFAQCGDPLSNAHPATITGDYAANHDPSTRWIIFGLALDGVTSVTFQPNQAAHGGATGPEVTVPVHDNLWVYESNATQGPYVLQPVTAHFADGTSVTEPATGQNCAAC
jgi:hypothetical protein